MLPVGILSALIVSFADDKTTQDTIYSVGIVSMWMLVLMVPWCIWAHKRHKSFEAKHDQLKGLYAPS
jgi:MFS-type transporter involved in bile tolerance (Atg22 family)